MIGDLVTIWYIDHVQFRHSVNPANIEPIILWTIGIVANETADYLTLVNEISPKTAADCTVPKANGFVIRKTDIIETTLLAEIKTTLNKAIGKGIKTIKLTQKPLSMRSKNEKLNKEALK